MKRDTIPFFLLHFSSFPHPILHIYLYTYFHLSLYMCVIIDLFLSMNVVFIFVLSVSLRMSIDRLMGAAKVPVPLSCVFLRIPLIL